MRDQYLACGGAHDEDTYRMLACGEGNKIRRFGKEGMHDLADAVAEPHDQVIIQRVRIRVADREISDERLKRFSQTGGQFICQGQLEPGQVPTDQNIITESTVENTLDTLTAGLQYIANLQRAI